mmetsp:Transcript_109090/g.326290  ORF Transcript_109090/g.326290 Transcript_109090/m.326290 type:complete len:244 (+) Transcript_109090:381-1112(+)
MNSSWDAHWRLLHAFRGAHLNRGVSRGGRKAPLCGTKHLHPLTAAAVRTLLQQYVDIVLFKQRRLPAEEPVVRPVSNLLLTTRSSVRTSAMALAAVPLPVVDAAVRPTELAVAVLHVVCVLALINHHTLLGLPDHLTLPRETPTIVLALVGPPVAPRLPSGTMLLVVEPLAFVLLRAALVDALAMPLSIDGLSNVGGTIAVMYGLAVLSSGPVVSGAVFALRAAGGGAGLFVRCYHQQTLLRL